MHKIVTIYQRRDGTVFLHGYSKTTMGLALACEPFIVVSNERLGQVPFEVMTLFGRAQVIIEHPAVFNQLEPLFSLARCRNWNEFTNGTSCIQVEEFAGVIAIIPTIKDKTGYKHLNEEKELCNPETFAASIVALLSPQEADSLCPRSPNSQD